MISILTTIIPLLLVIIIIVVIFTTINAIKKAAIFQKINVKWIVSFYGIILLVAIVLFYSLPTEKSSNLIVSKKEEVANAQRATDQLTLAASEGKQIDIENIEGVKVKKKWDIPFEGNKLEITGLGEQYYSGITLVKRKDVNDHNIEVTQYYTRTIIHNIDFTSKVKPYSLELVRDTLTINDPNQIDIRVGKMDKEFTITQFNGEKRNDPFDPFADETDVWGENVIYIQVPKDIKIEGNVQFVTE